MTLTFNSNAVLCSVKWNYFEYHKCKMRDVKELQISKVFFFTFALLYLCKFCCLVYLRLALLNSLSEHNKFRDDIKFFFFFLSYNIVYGYRSKCHLLCYVHFKRHSSIHMVYPFRWELKGIENVWLLCIQIFVCCNFTQNADFIF